MFKKRIGKDPHSGGDNSGGANGCPDIWELDSGDFMVIGLRKTNDLKNILPDTASCGHDEEIVIIPRALLTKAKNSIPDE